MTTAAPTARKYPAGAELSKQGVQFRLWAPRHQLVELALLEPDGLTPRRLLPMEREGGGYYSLQIPEARAGDLYGYRIDGHDRVFPDPGSRFQPQGVHGPSQFGEGQSGV